MKFFDTIGRVFYTELRTIFRDWGAILIFLIANVAYPMIYSFAYMNEDLRDVEICVIDKDNTKSSKKLIKLIDETSELKISSMATSMGDAIESFNKGEVHAIFRIPDNFEKNILISKTSPVSLFCDGAYFLFYKSAQKALLKSTSEMSIDLEVKKLMDKGQDYRSAKDAINPMDIKVFEEYNPGGGYGSFLMPGLIILILQQTLLIGIGLLGGSIKEKNYFRFYNVYLKNKGGVYALILGKAFAYTVIYLFNFILSLVVLNNLFGFPEKGMFINQIILVIPYFLAVSFLGLAISTLFKTRVHSLMFMVFLSPILLFFSGISWPKEAIPDFLNVVASVFPSQFAIPAFLRLKIMGVGLVRVDGELLALVIQVIVYFILACQLYRNVIRKSCLHKDDSPTIRNL